MKVQTLAFLFFTLPLQLLAHDTLQYTMRQYTDENGLPQNSVKSLGCDRSGFLWMLTENGVVRFDGQSFRSFNKNQLPLTSSRMSWLIPDLNTGALLGVTDKNQLVHMQDGQVSLLPHSNLISPGEKLPHTQDLYYQVFNALGLPNLYANLISVVNYKINRSNSRYFILNRDSIISWNKNGVEYAMKYPTGNFYDYILLRDRLYKVKDLRVTLIENNEAIDAGKVQGDIQKHTTSQHKSWNPKLYWNTTSDQAFIVLGSSLYLLKPAGNGLTTELLMNDFDFESNRILTIYYDARFRRIFMGSQTRGLFVFTRKPFFTLGSDQSDGDEVYYAQANYGKNGILTPQGYVFTLNDKITVLPALYKLIKEDRSSMLVDHNHNIWSKQRDNLYCFDSSGKRLLREMKFPHIITMLYEDQDQHLIVGNQYQHSWMLDLNSEKAEPVPFFEGINDMCFIQEEGKLRYWLGTGTGLYYADKITGKTASIPQLSGKYIRSIYVRQEGEIWITTYEDGYYLYDGAKLTRMPLDKGKFMASSHCIVEDEQGFFWITTNKGLFQVARQDLLDYAAGKLDNPFYLYYDKHTGFYTNEFNGGCQPCGLKTSEGYFSFPSLNGLVLGKTSLIVPEVPAHDFFIDRVEIDGEPIEMADTISLDTRFDFLRLFVTMPYYGNPYNRNLDFSLVKDGNAGTWLPLDADGSIKLSSLTSGHYEIRIRKVNGFGRDNHLVKKVLLVVPLAFYETAWFRTLMGVLIVAMFLLYMRIKLRYVKKKNEQLEVRIDERTQALKNTLQELQQSEESMRRQNRMQERLIAAITHDIKTPLKYLTGTARRLYENTEGVKGVDDNKKNAHLIYEAGYRMYHLTDNLLQYIKLNSSQHQIVFDNICLYELVQAKLQIFNEIAAEQSTVIRNRISPDTRIRSNHHLLGIVIHNLIDNAVKATFEGEINISAAGSGSEICIKVEDSGFGMNDETREWCNHEQASATDIRESGKSGLGLIIVKDLVAQMQGRVRVGNRPDQGTVVELIFPV